MRFSLTRISLSFISSHFFSFLSSSLRNFFFFFNVLSGFVWSDDFGGGVSKIRGVKEFVGVLFDLLPAFLFVHRVQKGGWCLEFAFGVHEYISVLDGGAVSWVVSVGFAVSFCRSFWMKRGGD